MIIKKKGKSLSDTARATLVLGRLKKRYPVLETHLVAENAWELLIATILAAQCTDERVNKVTPELFKRWPGPFEMAEAEQGELEAVVRSTGFFRNKAKNIMGSARMIRDEFEGRVPDSMLKLVQLPGVARKTANVVLWGAYKKNEGIAVDTHVSRISLRLGFSKDRDPVRTEKILMKLFPQEDWGKVNHMLVWFGRHVCTARKPACEDCEMQDICEKNGLDLRVKS